MPLEIFELRGSRWECFLRRMGRDLMIPLLVNLIVSLHFSNFDISVCPTHEHATTQTALKRNTVCYGQGYHCSLWSEQRLRLKWPLFGCQSTLCSGPWGMYSPKMGTGMLGSLAIAVRPPLRNCDNVFSVRTSKLTQKSGEINPSAGSAIINLKTTNGTSTYCYGTPVASGDDTICRDDTDSFQLADMRVLTRYAALANLVLPDSPSNSSNSMISLPTFNNSHDIQQFTRYYNRCRPGCVPLGVIYRIAVMRTLREEKSKEIEPSYDSLHCSRPGTACLGPTIACYVGKLCADRARFSRADTGVDGKGTHVGSTRIPIYKISIPAWLRVSREALFCTTMNPSGKRFRLSKYTIAMMSSNAIILQLSVAFKVQNFCLVFVNETAMSGLKCWPWLTISCRLASLLYIFFQTSLA